LRAAKAAACVESGTAIALFKDVSEVSLTNTWGRVKALADDARASVATIADIGTARVHAQRREY
jgi:hypothetical protein